MAKYDPTRFHSDNKPCEQCGVPFFRKYGQTGVNWTKRRFCGRTCQATAQRKAAPPSDLTGKKFGRWIVLGYAGRDGHDKHSWACECACGVCGHVEDSALKVGNSKSCGCAQREAASAAGEATRTHGMSKSAPEYYVWCSMKQRCLNPNVINWPDYGGRGITVCDRWRDSFEAFFADMGPRPSPQHSIDRIDPNGNYEPKNVRWADPKTQAQNKRCALEIMIDGASIPLADAASNAGLKYSTVRARMKKGWPAERLLEPKS